MAGIFIPILNLASLSLQLLIPSALIAAKQAFHRPRKLLDQVYGQDSDLSSSTDSGSGLRGSLQRRVPGLSEIQAFYSEQRNKTRGAIPKIFFIWLGIAGEQNFCSTKRPRLTPLV